MGSTIISNVMADKLIDIVRLLMLKNDAHVKENLTLALLSRT